MADPLAALAEREVPERTNFFDPEGARTIISRYASNRRTGEDLGRSYDRVSQIQDRDRQAAADELRMKRDQLALTQEDEDYAARKEALARKGEFMEKLYAIRGDDPDYDTKITAFFGSVPAPLLEEPEVKAALTYKNQVADDARSRRNADASRQSQYEFWEKKFGMNAGLKTAMKGATPEMFARHTDPTTGETNYNAVAAEAYEADNLRKREDWKFKADAVLQNRMKLADKMNLSRSARGLRDELETYIEDPGAFPRQSQSVLAAFRREKGANATPDMMMGEWADRYAEAQAWDKKPLERELIAAQNYDDPDEYVRLGGEGLNENQKKYREKMWQLAHKEDVFDEAPAEGASAAPTPGGAKPLTDAAVAADFLKRAGGDKTKAREMARAEGYSF